MNLRRILLVIFVIILISGTVLLILHRRVYESYPMLFLEETLTFSAEFEVPQEYLLAMIKTESGFKTEAQSSAGALGLMQIMPSTFEEIAMRLSEEPGDIFDAETNIRYGAYYLAYLYRQFGDWGTAFAAYNAGMGRVNGWLADERYSNDGITLHDIPIEETKNYIVKINKAIEEYREKLEKKSDG